MLRSIQLAHCQLLSIAYRGRLQCMATSSLGKTARIISKRTLAESKWLRFVDAAVSVFAVLKSKTKPPEIIIVKQFRPPLGKFTIELCAGLIDPGDTPEQSALRELKEETGYDGRVVATSGKGYLSTGLTNESIITVFVEVDADLPEHQHPPAQSEDDQAMIEVATLPLPGLVDQLKELEAKGYGVWIGLYAIAQGLAMREAMGL